MDGIQIVWYRRAIVVDKAKQSIGEQAGWGSCIANIDTDEKSRKEILR